MPASDSGAALPLVPLVVPGKLAEKNGKTIPGHD